MQEERNLIEEAVDNIASAVLDEVEDASKLAEVKPIVDAVAALAKQFLFDVNRTADAMAHLAVATEAIGIGLVSKAGN